LVKIDKHSISKKLDDFLNYVLQNLKKIVYRRLFANNLYLI